MKKGKPNTLLLRDRYCVNNRIDHCDQTYWLEQALASLWEEHVFSVLAECVSITFPHFQWGHPTITPRGSFF